MISPLIRIATPADAELIAEMSQRTFFETFAESNTKEDMDKFLKEQFRYDLLLKEVGAPGNIFLVAEYESEPVGYARLRENNNPPELQGKTTLEIARIYAEKKMIGKGIGQALMTRSIEIAREMNVGIVWLGVWEKNQRAIDFYIKWGFEKFSEHPFVVGNDVQTDWLMKKIL